MISKGDQRNQPIGPLANGQSVFVARESEARRLREAILKRQSLVLCGPAGIGKTALMAKVCSELPQDVARATLCLSSIDGLRSLLRGLLRELYAVGDPTLRRQLHVEGVRHDTFKAWLNSLITSRLKGALYRSMETGQYWVFLDHLPPLTHAMAKVVRELVWMRNTPVYLVARCLTPEDVGHIASLYWSESQRLRLGPLNEAASHKLLEVCIQQFGLAGLELEDFSEEVLSLSGRSPGALIEMCRLAADPRYHSGSGIKTKLIRIDYLMNLVGRNEHDDGKQGHCYTHRGE
jgi:hypothetical protein